MAAPTSLNFSPKPNANVVADDKVDLHFYWKGPTSTWKGLLYVGVVDLVIEGGKTEISVSIPEQNAADKVQKLPFHLRRNPGTFLLKESDCDGLKLSIEQIQKLTLKAGMFEPSPYKGPAIMDSRGQRIDEKRLLRSDQEIKFQKPEDLKAGQTYRLLITSDDLSLKASLVKEEPQVKKETTPVSPASTSTDASQLETDRQELFETIRGPLLMLMGGSLMNFTVRISSIRTKAPLNITPNPNMNGLDQIQDEIKKMDKDVLRDLMKKVRTQKEDWKQLQTQTQKSALEKVTFGLCFNAITTKGLENMMRAHLKAITQNQCSEELDPIIEQISVRFREICMNNISP